MKMSVSSWGATAGLVLAIVVLAATSVMLLHSDGANYKVLIAVWLWALPVAGFFSGIGYAIGKIIEAIVRANAPDDKGGMHADAR